MFFLLMIIIFGVLMFNNLYFLWLMLMLTGVEVVRLIKSPEMKFKYFMVSEFAIMFFILGTCLGMENLCIGSLMLKLGFPPFHFWLFDVFLYLSNKEAFVMMTWAKTLPSLVLFCYTSFLVTLLMSFSFVLSQILPMSAGFNFKSMFFFGSYVNLSLSVLVATMSLLLSVKFFFVYMLMLTFSWSTNSPENFLNFDPWFFFNLMGLPPSPLFFLKMMVFFPLCNKLGPFVIIMLLLSSVVISFYMFFLLNSLFSEKKKLGDKSMLWLVFLVTFFILF